MNVASTTSHKFMAFLGLVLIVVVAGATTRTGMATGGGAAALSRDEAVKRAASASNSGGYKDGTYRAVGAYDTPESTEAIGVSLTLQNGVVVSSTADTNPTRPQSQRYQADFIRNYKAQVVGRSLDELDLQRVAGSSLTSAGFDVAVARIKIQAKG